MTGFILLAVIVIALLPNLVKIGLKVIKRGDADVIKSRLGYKKNIALFSLFIGAWIAYGISFYFMARMFTPLTGEMIFFIPMAFVCASIAANLAVIFPAGLGAREGMLLALLQLFFGMEISIAVTFVSRLIIVAGEFAFALIGVLLWKRDGKAFHTD